MIAILLAAAGKVFILRRFARALLAITDAYDTIKESFKEQTPGSFCDCTERAKEAEYVFLHS